MLDDWIRYVGRGPHCHGVRTREVGLYIEQYDYRQKSVCGELRRKPRPDAPAPSASMFHVKPIDRRPMLNASVPLRQQHGASEHGKLLTRSVDVVMGCDRVWAAFDGMSTRLQRRTGRFT